MCVCVVHLVENERKRDRQREKKGIYLFHLTVFPNKIQNKNERRRGTAW